MKPRSRIVQNKLEEAAEAFFDTPGMVELCNYLYSKINIGMIGPLEFGSVFKHEFPTLIIGNVSAKIWERVLRHEVYRIVGKENTFFALSEDDHVLQLSFTQKGRQTNPALL